LGEYLLWVVFRKLLKKPLIVGILSSVQVIQVILTKKSVGLHFWSIFSQTSLVTLPVIDKSLLGMKVSTQVSKRDSGLRCSEEVGLHQGPDERDRRALHLALLRLRLSHRVKHCFWRYGYQLLPIATNCFKLLQTATNCYQLLQTATNYYKLLQTAAKVLQTVTNCHQLQQTVSNCYKLLPTVTNCYKLLQTAAKVLQTVTNCHQLQQTATNCYKLLPTVTNCYKLLQKYYKLLLTATNCNRLLQTVSKKSRNIFAQTKKMFKVHKRDLKKSVRSHQKLSKINK
jgi:hypothetical protein